MLRAEMASPEYGLSCEWSNFRFGPNLAVLTKTLARLDGRQMRKFGQVSTGLAREPYVLRSASSRHGLTQSRQKTWARTTLVFDLRTVIRFAAGRHRSIACPILYVALLILFMISDRRDHPCKVTGRTSAESTNCQE